MMIQPTLFSDTKPEIVPRFGGQTFDPVIDGPRLTNHLKKVLAFMSDGRWRHLSTIANHVGCSEASASARLRDLRKPWAGSHQVDRKRIKETGLWIYRLKI